MAAVRLPERLGRRSGADSSPLLSLVQPHPWPGLDTAPPLYGRVRVLQAVQERSVLGGS